MGQLRTLLLYEPMKSCRIHIMGASGGGVTTLGRAVGIEKPRQGGGRVAEEGP
jgi:hypothetical protein